MSDWLNNMVIVKGDEVITKLRNAECEVSSKMLKLAKQARERWLSVYRRELEELIEGLRRGETTIIISGDPLDKNKSFTVHLYTEGLAIKVARVAKSGNITINITLDGLVGVHVTTPKLFNDKALRASQCGLMLTDGSIDNGYPIMNTTQLWQATIFPLMFPGKIRMRIHSLNINDGGVSVVWHLRAVEHKDSFKGKAGITEEVSRLDDAEFMAFLLHVILGDGHVDIKEKGIRLYMGKAKHELWGKVIDRLEGLGFRKYDGEYKVDYVVNSSKAVELARKMLSDKAIKALIEDLSPLLDAEKLRRLIELTSVETKPRGRSSIEVAGIKMTVHMSTSGSVWLTIQRSDYGNAVKILELLRNAGYRETELNKHGDRYVVYMGIDVIKKYPELTSRVCEVLRKMHEEAVNESKVERAWKIAKAIKRLGCQ
ncbi:hypothetical protein [Vulcanisaeta sp. JCM 16161]|uniref:hypothetical protein n=1 Tax=Vulcanisaeta sp. JCM 16161 TaxID=1295372 RepID=UPI001FB4991B|nr:hypothetical protein [Vulcanisaeta sp. JCM 16161]